MYTVHEHDKSPHGYAGGLPPRLTGSRPKGFDGGATPTFLLACGLAKTGASMEVV